MAIGQAIDSAAAQATAMAPASGNVVALRMHAQRLTKPRLALDERLLRAGLAIAAHAVSAYDGTDVTSDSGFHAPSVIGVLATLAAEAAQQAAAINRRTATEVATGGWIHGGPADVVLFRGAGNMQTIWQAIATAAIEAGVNAADLPDLEGIVAHAEAHIGEKPYPALTVASTFRPRALLRAAAARLRHDVQGLAADEGLCTPHEQALACGTAIAHVIRTEPRPEVLTHLAAEMLIGAARLAPLPY